MKKNIVTTKQNLDINLLFIEQTLYLFDNLPLTEDVKEKIRELNNFIYSKLYTDIKDCDIKKQCYTLTTYYQL